MTKPTMEWADENIPDLSRDIQTTLTEGFGIGADTAYYITLRIAMLIRQSKEITIDE